jgi:acetyl esterase/lipase
MASPEYEKLSAVLKPGLAVASDPPDLVREKMTAVHPKGGTPAGKVEYLELSGVPAAWVSTAETQEDRAVLLVHGGAFVSTTITHYELYAENLARAAQARVLVFEYRLAPEHRHPAQLDDTLAVYEGAIAQGLDPSRTAFMGDSCGGGIAIAAMCALRDRGKPLPACYAGLTPWLDASQEGDAAVNPRGVDPYVNRDWILARFRDYAGPEGDLRNPLISPLEADLTGLPPLFFGVGQIDTTSDDSTRMAARAIRDGVSVTLDATAEMIHGFHGLCGAFPEATEGVARAGAFVRRHIP